MANALQSSMPPDAPNPQPQQPMQGNPMQAGNAPGNPLQGAPQQPAPPPAPTHQQTVAALRHFGALETELTGLLKDPDLGKSDMKSKIIDGATRLVASREVTPAQAVAQLGTVPDRPFDQKKWLESQLQTVTQAQMAVLAHHAAAFPGGSQDQTPNDPDQHLDMLAGLRQQYKGQPNG